MQLNLKRYYYSDSVTLGLLFIGSKFFCFTLEPGRLDDKGPIPVGGYDVIVDVSKRFKRRMPLLQNVPNFEGIRIHSGNTEADTSGCILVGKTTDGKSDVGESKVAFDLLFTLIDEAFQSTSVRIEIEQIQFKGE